MRALLLVIGCVAFVGCTFGANTCDDMGGCEAGAVCQAGFCVAPATGAGTGGGSTGGGGGGGGALGGGGGGGGGTANLCDGVVCPAGYSCEKSTGACLLRVTGLVIVSPNSGRTNDAGVLLLARLTADASVTLPPSIRYELNDGGSQTLDLAGDDYAQLLTLADGRHTLRVIAEFTDAGFSASVDVSVDTDGPTVMATLPTSVQQRDEVFPLNLTTSEPIELSSVEVRLAGVRLDAATGACVANAGCWVVDMSVPALDAMTGSFAVSATATDLAGNTKVTALGSVGVTRKRWESEITTQELRAAPAIGRDGTIYIGARGSALTGTLLALNPTDGGVKNSAALLGAIQSVATAVSNDAGLVYFTSNDATGGQVGSRSAEDLSLPSGIRPATSGNGVTPTYSALGLVEKSATEVGAIAVFNTEVSAGRVVIYGSSSAPAGDNAVGSAFDFAPVPTPASVANNIVVDGSAAYLITTLSGTGLNWQPISNVTGNPTAGVAVPLETGGRDCCLSGQAFLSGSSLVGGTTVGSRQLYLVSAASMTRGDLGVAADYGTPVVSAIGDAFVGRGTNELVRFNPSMLGSTGVVLKSGAGIIRTSPVLGRARTGQAVGLGYAVNSTGTLFAFAQDGSAGSASDWGSAFVGGSTVYAHPTLDCNRRIGAATARTGVLYVVGSTKVSAIVVDSPRLLDTVGSWPKYQRTAGNAGNCS